MNTPTPQVLTLAPEAATPVDRALARELSLIRVTHIQHPGPKGGRPKEREVYLDDTGVKLLLDTLPPADRLRFADGQELACRGSRSGDTVSDLVPLVSNDAVHSEFMRRQHRAMLEDMETMRRSTMESHTQALKNQNDQLKMLGGMADMIQAMMERSITSMEQRERKDDDGLVDKVIAGIAEQFLGPQGGLKDMLMAARAGKG